MTLSYKTEVIVRGTGGIEESFFGETLGEVLPKAVPVWRERSRLFKDSEGVLREITVNEMLLGENDTGIFYAIEIPAEPISTGTLIALVIGAVALSGVIYMAFFGMPKPATNAGRNRNNRGGSGAFSERRNEPMEPGTRLPDLFGEDVIYPKLLSPVYTRYEDGVQKEYSYMVVTCGSADISELKDGSNPISDVAGYGVRIYGPGTSPNSGTPAGEYGLAVSEPVRVMRRSSDVVDQVLFPPNRGAINGFNDIRFGYPNEIEISPTSELDFSDVFSPGDTLSIASASYTEGATTVNLAGSYTIGSVSAGLMTLLNPHLVNSDWSVLNSLPTDKTAYISPTLSPTGSKWLGPFILDDPACDRVMLNVIAPQGLYKDNGDNQIRTDVEVEVELTPINASYGAVGAVQTFSETLTGSAVTRNGRGLTIEAVPTIGGRQSVRIRRVTETDRVFNGAVSDTVNVQDLYSMSPAPSHFGDLTTVQLMASANQGTLAVKERKFNCRARRKLPLRVSGSTFSTTLHATSDAAQIISFLALSPEHGRLSADEIDFDGIFDARDAVVNSFGDSAYAFDFNHVFDNMDLTFEETISSIASAVHCAAVRSSGKLTLIPDISPAVPRRVFNHRNILPKTCTRAYRFGTDTAYDSVEIEYRRLSDNEEVTQRYPATGTSPKKLEVVGARTSEQTAVHLRRHYARMTYENSNCEFETAQEGAGVYPGERVFVSRTDSASVVEGEIRSASGNVLTLSQPQYLDTGKSYVIFVQSPQNTVETVGVSVPGPGRYEVTLSRPLSFVPVNGDSGGVPSTYSIVEDKHDEIDLYTVKERDSENIFKHKLIVTKYDFRMYLPDITLLSVDYDSNISDFRDDGYKEFSLTLTDAAAENVPGIGFVYSGSSATSSMLPEGIIASASYTKFMFIRIASFTDEQDLFSSYESTDERLYIRTDRTIASAHGSIPSTISVPAPLENVWFSLCVTYDYVSRKKYIYIDGEQINYLSDVLPQTRNNITIGGWNHTSGFTGDMYSIRYLTRALTSREVQTMHRMLNRG